MPLLKEAGPWIGELTGQRYGRYACCRNAAAEHSSKQGLDRAQGSWLQDFTIILKLQLLLLLAPSPCKRAKPASSPEPKFTGHRSISCIFEGLEVREVLVPSALLRFCKMQNFAFVREPAFAERGGVWSTSAASDFHEIL